MSAVKLVQCFTWTCLAEGSLCSCLHAASVRRQFDVPCACLQGLSVTELEAQMLARGGFSQQQQPQAQVHQQAGLPQPGQRPAQSVYSQSSSGLYSPTAAAALARLTQSAQQGHQAQPTLANSPNLQRLSPLLQSSILANQMQQRQGRPTSGPVYVGRPGKLPSAFVLCRMCDTTQILYMHAPEGVATR